jgi:hypothetical protein
MKTAKELGITEEQRYNLAKLALFFISGGHRKSKVKFDIKNFFVRGLCYRWTTVNNAVYDCNTSACLIGFGPLAGIRKDYGRTFTDYCRSFFAEGFNYDFLFDWKHTNTIASGVRRISYFLKFGLPDNVDKCHSELSIHEVKEKPDRAMLNKIVKDYEKKNATTT